MSDSIEFPSPRGGRLVQWLVRHGARVERGQTIAHALVQDEKSKRPVVSPSYGRVIHFSVSDGEDVEGLGSNMSSEKPVVGKIERCQHRKVYADMCTQCGASIREIKTEKTCGTKRAREEESESEPLFYTFNARAGHQLSVAPEEAERSDTAFQRRLLGKRQLSLVLDLDHTLVHATCDRRAEALVNIAPLHTFYIGNFKYYVKRRPNLEKFLRAAAQHFELQVDTAASREYAEIIVSLIDPDCQFFGEHPRIVSRSDSDKNMRHKQVSWLHNSLLDDSMALVIDDTEAVWKGAKYLLVIEPYHFIGFRKLSEVNNASGVSVISTETSDNSEATVDTKRSDTTETFDSSLLEQDTDSYLLHLLRLAFYVHRKFYEAVGITIPEEEYDVDMLANREKIETSSTEAESVPISAKEILQNYIQSILRGLCIVFSGVFPVNSVPHETPLWRRTCQFGATIKNDIDDSVTHVVAKRPGTQKVIDASKKENIRIVHLSWLQETLRTYTLQDESLHKLQDFETHCSKPISIHGTEGHDESDEDEQLRLMAQVLADMDSDDSSLSSDQDES